MAFDALDFVRLEGEFRTLAGGDLWDRVEAVAWEYVERQRGISAEKTKAFRSTVFGARYHRESERRRRKRNQTIVRAVRCCRVCRTMYTVTAQQLIDGTGKFCTPSCFGKWNRQQHAPRPTRYVTIRGRKRSLPEWAKHYGITVGMVYKRMRDGMTEVEALTRPKVKRAGNEKRIALYGETLSIAQWARRYGLQPNTVITRMRRGATLEEALGRPPQSRRRAA